MTYNLLFDTQFEKGACWEYKNCRYENGHIISTSNVFGIAQQLTLSKETRLYLRGIYNTLSSAVNKIYCGVQIGETLYTSIKHPKQGVEQLISIVETATDKSIKIQFIFESSEKENILLFKEPLLCDLIQLHKSYYIKPILDKILKYRVGHSYKNLLPFSEIKPNIFNLQKAKIGCLCETKSKHEYIIPIKLVHGNKYMVKLDYYQLNELGKIYLNYGVLKSTVIENNQCYLVFKASEKNLILNIESNAELPYLVNLRHLMIIDLNTINVDKESIPYLPFV